MKRRDFLKYGIGAGTTLAGKSAFATPAKQAPAAATGMPLPTTRSGGDLALVNARIVTLEPQQPEAEAALVRNGRIVLIGSSADVRAQARGARVFDAAGRAVVPGFIDAHCHMEVTVSGAVYQADLHSPPIKSIRDIQSALKAKASTTPRGQWVVGRAGFNLENSVAEERLPLREELDTVSTEHPVIVFSGRHVSMLNSRAIREIGAWESDDTLPRGTIVHRDAAGVPTGIATEVFYYLPDYSVDQVKAAVKAHARELFVTKGTTTIYTIPFSANDIRADLELQAEGELPLRLRVFYHVPHTISADGLFDTGLISGVGDDMFRFGGMKLFVDGFGDLGNGTVDLKWTQEELDDLVGRAHTRGMQVLMHVKTAPARRMAIAAVEAARRRDPRPELLHRIEHNGDDGTRENIRRLRELGVRVSITPGRPRPGQGLQRYQTLLQEHFEPVGATDATGTTPTSPDVLLKIAYIANTVDEGGGAAKGEALDFENALRMFTSWSAGIGYEDRDKGSIAVGKLGDFAVLSKDPRGRPPAELFDNKIDATILGGVVIFER